MEKVIERVEQRIMAPLPEEVKLLVKHAYCIRNEQMEKIMNGEMLIGEQVDISMLFKLIIGQGVETKIRTGEQIQVGKAMQSNILSIEKGRGSDARREEGDIDGIIQT